MEELRLWLFILLVMIVLTVVILRELQSALDLRHDLRRLGVSVRKLEKLIATNTVLGAVAIAAVIVAFLFCCSLV